MVWCKEWDPGSWSLSLVIMLGRGPSPMWHMKRKNPGSQQKVSEVGECSLVRNRYSAAFVSMSTLWNGKWKCFQNKEFQRLKVRQGYNMKEMMSYHTSVHQNSCSCQYQCTCCYHAMSGSFSTADSVERDTQATFREKSWEKQCTVSLVSYKWLPTCAFTGHVPMNRRKTNKEYKTTNWLPLRLDDKRKCWVGYEMVISGLISVDLDCGRRGEDILFGRMWV